MGYMPMMASEEGAAAVKTEDQIDDTELGGWM